MKAFELLAQKIEVEWSSANHSLEAFSEIATAALREFQYDLSLEQLNSLLSKWLLANAQLPEQINVHNTFGQPPITVFNNNKFVIDIYIWVNFDTSIHSHGFRGAFRLLHGRSLQENFQVKTVEKIFSDVMIVDMNDKSMSLLEEGAVHTIAPGFQLTHRVIHLANPTVTLCVKTINEPELKQWNYMTTGLAVQKQNIQPDLIKKIYYFNYLLGQNEPQAQEFLKILLDQLETSIQIHIYEDVASGAYDLVPEAVQVITESIVERHETSAWWPLYEAAHMSQMNELFFSSCNDPISRLVAHFINSGDSLTLVKPFLNGLSGEEIKGVVTNLMNIETIFNSELSNDDRQIIKGLIADPKMPVPLHLKQFEQISKIRSFLNH
jgi:hypothetical protein